MGSSTSRRSRPSVSSSAGPRGLANGTCFIDPAARKRALSEWDKANPGAVYDPELFRREILPRLASVKLMDIAEAAGCSKASASDIRRGKWTPHVSTWAALAGLAGAEIEFAVEYADTHSVRPAR